MNELLGGHIKSLRSAKRFTQEQVAEEIGISRQRYARIENGTANISLEILLQLAKVFDVTVGDITRVLDEDPAAIFRAGSGHAASEKMFDMLDLFYANKHLYAKLQRTGD